MSDSRTAGEGQGDWQFGTQAITAAELQVCVRDLMSLIALPALTVSSNPRDIICRFGEALVSLLPIRFCVVTAMAFSEDAPIITVCRQGVDNGEDALGSDWQEYGRRCAEVQGSQLQIGDEDTPCGQLRVVKLAMSVGQDSGTLVVGADSRLFPGLAHSAALRAAASLAAGRLKAARLVHEREQAARVKDEFLAMLGHELRNPLAPIVTALDLMRLRGKDEATLREQQIIRRQVDHLIRLVDDLMDVSRITRGKVELRSVTTEISVVLGDAVEMASLLIEQRRHHLQIDAPDSGLRWTGDPTRLAQVVANLLTNAARYTEPGGQIRLSAKREDRQVVISVSDNGTGMDADLLPHVFEMFEQGPRSIDRAEGGLGLGLALVRSLVRMHDGTVEALSPGKGQGSEFVVRMPLPDETVESTMGAPPERAANPARNPLRILLVDDNIDGADAMLSLLEAHGHQVLVAYNPVTALQRCAAFVPQLALIDIGMPVMDGYELALRLRELSGMGDLVLIAMTGYGRDHDLKRSRQADFAEHLVKPIKPETLLQLIDRVGVGAAPQPPS